MATVVDLRAAITRTNVATRDKIEQSQLDRMAEILADIQSRAVATSNVPIIDDRHPPRGTHVFKYKNGVLLHNVYDGCILPDSPSPLKGIYSNRSKRKDLGQRIQKITGLHISLNAVEAESNDGSHTYTIFISMYASRKQQYAACVRHYIAKVFDYVRAHILGAIIALATIIVIIILTAVLSVVLPR